MVQVLSPQLLLRQYTGSSPVSTNTHTLILERGNMCIVIMRTVIIYYATRQMYCFDEFVSKSIHAMILNFQMKHAFAHVCGLAHCLFSSAASF
mmetsp:Transcript_16202/g.24020  ORF Transcript_16202/g.24020 Transcript_16202/m.24020 type:complete len:93 (+) Transcript_16202:912-1190(+)